TLSLHGNESALCAMVEVFLTFSRDQIRTEINLAEKRIGDKEMQFLVDVLRNNTVLTTF
ncbi:unnamed protein product, partial [Rotaria magnacalcarata]